MFSPGKPQLPSSQRPSNLPNVSMRPNSAKATRKKIRGTQTIKSNFFEEPSLPSLKEPIVFNNELKRSYKDAVEYINKCHALMNKIVVQKIVPCSGDNKNYFQFPDVPDYMNVFFILMKDDSKIIQEKESTVTVNIQKINLVKREKSTQCIIIQDVEENFEAKEDIKAQKLVLCETNRQNGNSAVDSIVEVNKAVSELGCDDFFKFNAIRNDASNENCVRENNAVETIALSEDVNPMDLNRCPRDLHLMELEEPRQEIPQKVEPLEPAEFDIENFITNFIKDHLKDAVSKAKDSQTEKQLLTNLGEFFATKDKKTRPSQEDNSLAKPNCLIPEPCFKKNEIKPEKLSKNFVEVSRSEESFPRKPSKNVQSLENYLPSNKVKHCNSSKRFNPEIINEMFRKVSREKLPVNFKETLPERNKIRNRITHGVNSDVSVILDDEEFEAMSQTHSGQNRKSKPSRSSPKDVTSSCMTTKSKGKSKRNFKEEMLSNIGIFGKNGEIRPEYAKIFVNENLINPNCNKNKTCRSKHQNDIHVHFKPTVMNMESDSTVSMTSFVTMSSDIKSDSELELIEFENRKMKC